MPVLILGADREAWLAALREAMPDERFVLEPEDGIDAAVVANPPPGSLQGLPKLRLIQSVWAGVDRLLQDPTLPPDVPLARMVDPAMNEAMVHTALWAVLSLHRSFFELAAQQREQRWQQPLQPRAAEWRVLVLGRGELGGRVADALELQGYAVSSWRSSDGPEPPLEGADTVVNLLPLTPATRGFFDAARLARMKPGASLVNLARGAHVVEADLLAALDTGRLRHAVLDVFETEPLPLGHRLWTHPRVTVLPHCAAQTDPRSALEVVVANLRALRAGEPLRHLVDRSRGY
ncbi:glyoxylate/hydroxypyruvate reductase A [Paucibacter sp. R3-3]|uniref:Glyoxylate/hydroxypyruvate reductase A n=1 Tax=Roseateles agri TaxID=3098619 RepID=A0ABU5DE75_9BURK|nr:glyoxylate/hydroxypyruvate reductase A [Paucibacter sp. R3-3]MDY0744577.1 glyoxylate/hydroxypyruvate reductase A [Paucibacter sp. R3-3]